MITVIKGSTKTLKAEFYNRNLNQKIHPKDVIFKIYTYENHDEPVFGTHLNKDLHVDTDNNYFYDYTFNTEGKFWYEFLGNNAGYTFNDRGLVNVVFGIEE